MEDGKVTTGSRETGEQDGADVNSVGGGQQSTDGKTSDNSNTADLDKLVQARADKLTAEMGKKNAALQKELDKLKKEKMTADELKQLEMEEKEKAIAEREKMLLDKENRLIAIKAIKEAGLDDGSDIALQLVDFVIGNNEEEISNKVKTFSELVTKLVSSKVDKTFKKNGRTPNNSGATNNDRQNDNTVAEKLGKARADKQKKSNDILKFYTGR